MFKYRWPSLRNKDIRFVACPPCLHILLRYFVGTNIFSDSWWTFLTGHNHARVLLLARLNVFIYIIYIYIFIYFTPVIRVDGFWCGTTRLSFRTSIVYVMTQRYFSKSFLDTRCVGIYPRTPMKTSFEAYQLCESWIEPLQLFFWGLINQNLFLWDRICLI